jgi:hypothetical protein
MSDLNEVLKKFDSRLKYREYDRNALDISRSLAAGNLGDDKNYAEWAAITDDPLVVANYVKTYITTLVSKLSGAPCRPEKQTLMELGKSVRLNSIFTDTYQDVLNDGYAYLGVGMKDGKPVVKPIDARYILFNGDCPTLSDATDVVVFEVVPLPLNEDLKAQLKHPDDHINYVDYDPQSERVRVTHYHKTKDGVVMDFYDDDYKKPTSLPLTGLDRIPVIRFVGDKVELQDKRYHYRGIYYMMSSVLKALALSGTKINSRTASSDDDNYIVRQDAIANGNETWKNSGTKEIANVDQNANEIPSVQFIPHDNDFLMRAFENWKAVIADMLGPVVASGSEAVTREEVKARNEVKDAISNIYLSRIADSIEEVYRVIQMLKENDPSEVVIVGGFIDSVKKQKDIAQLEILYTKAKEAGMNTEGIVREQLAMTDLPTTVKEAILTSFTQDPFKSPQVLQLQDTVQKLNQTIQQQNTQIALLRLQATQRLERQKEFIDSTERTKRLELAYKQWSDEAKQTQEGLMAILNDCLQKQDYDGAIAVMEQIKSQSNPIITDKVINFAANAFTAENENSVQKALDETVQPAPQVPQPPQGPAPVSPQPTFRQTVPNQQAIKQEGNATAPMPRPAVTPYTDA